MTLTWRKQLIAAIVLVVVNAYSCNEASEGPVESTNGEGVILPDGTVFTRAALLDSVGACIVGELENFQEQSQTFKTAVTAAASNSDEMESAQLAWRSTMDAWQQLEVMQIGPAGIGTQPGGLGLRDAIYAWPLNSPCAVDKHLVSESYANDASVVRANADGLGATEYLLFYAGSDNACSLEDEINTSGVWDELDENTLLERRAAYAAFAAETVAETASALLNAWVPTGENFLAELTEAGEGSRTFGKKRVALNAVSDALFYVEWATKDNKLARPLGLIGCEQAFCPELVESDYGRRSKQHVRNNIIGFRKIFRGCGADYEGLGFDDYLFAVGQPELAETIDQAVLSIIEAIDAIEEEDLVTALEEDIQSVSDVHTSVDTLTDLLRSEFLTVLRLELPQMVQGDND